MGAEAGRDRKTVALEAKMSETGRLSGARSFVSVESCLLTKYQNHMTAINLNRILSLDLGEASSMGVLTVYL